MSRYLEQSAEAERKHDAFARALRTVADAIGAKVGHLDRDSLDIKLPEGWTPERFFEEVRRRSGT